MAEFRIGHDQIILHIDRMQFTDGALVVTASGWPPYKKSQKITGDQPIMIVCDDGSIYGTWHADFTKSWEPARRNPNEHVTFVQRMESTGIVAY
jgi:hypothetical protein